MGFTEQSTHRRLSTASTTVLRWRMVEGGSMSDNKPPKTLWVRPVKPTTDDTPAKWPSGDQATLAYTQRKARCISYIELTQFMEDVERRADAKHATTMRQYSSDFMEAMQELVKEIEEGKA